MQIHVAPVFAPPRIQENTPDDLFMYWFRARGYFLVLLFSYLGAEEGEEESGARGTGGKREYCK